MPKVKCQDTHLCEIECKHKGEHELIVVGRYGNFNFNCRELARLCDYTRKAERCEEVEE